MKITFLLLIAVILNQANAFSSVENHKWFCAYNWNAKLDAGIYFDKNYDKKSAMIDVLQSCQRWEGSKCKKRFVRCDQHTQHDGMEYLCQSTKNNSSFEGRGGTNLEAQTRAMKDCRWSGASKCRIRLLRCKRVKEKSIWDSLRDIF
ncbi:hypothetical protein N9N67_07115 [Bacteriovoracaceae bacterium]|nr:hypothetical protein [Bacteriovoracaceae bacterium]